MPVNRVYLGQKAVQKKSRDEYDTSRDHHAGNIGCAVCAGCGLDLQTGRLEGRGLQRQLRLLPQPLRGPGHQEEITKTGLLHETRCSSPVLWLCHRNDRERFWGTFHGCLLRTRRAGRRRQRWCSKGPATPSGRWCGRCAAAPRSRPPGAAQKAHSQQVCPHGVVRLIVVEALINGALPAAVFRRARPVPLAILAQGVPGHIALLRCHWRFPLLGSSSVALRENRFSASKSRRPARPSSGPAWWKAARPRPA